MGSFKFTLACIGEESEWNIISSKAGAGYFGHNELNEINLSFVFNKRNCFIGNKIGVRVIILEVFSFTINTTATYGQIHGYNVTLETLRFLCLNERNISLVAICAII